MERLGRLRNFPTLYAIINLESCPVSPVDFGEKLFTAGVKLVQLRAKNRSIEEIKIIAAELVSIRNSRFPSSDESRPLLVVNDHIGICRAVGADGVHLGQTDTTAKIAREILGAGAFIGLSTHSVQQFRSGCSEPVDYLAVGPIFSTASKPNHEPLVGIRTLHEICLESPLPVVAIGGVSLENVASVYGSGAASVAVISDLESAENLAAHVEKYQRLFVSSATPSP